MKTRITALVTAGALALSACQMTDQQGQAAVTGGALGLITATALGADPEWILLGTLAGAAAGTLVAQNSSTGQCAYSNGDGTYYRAPCPT